MAGGIGEDTLYVMMKTNLRWLDEYLEDWEPSKKDLELGVPAGDLPQHKRTVEAIQQYSSTQVSKWKALSPEWGMEEEKWKVLGQWADRAWNRIADLLYEHDPEYEG